MSCNGYKRSAMMPIATFPQPASPTSLPPLLHYSRGFRPWLLPTFPQFHLHWLTPDAPPPSLLALAPMPASPNATAPFLLLLPLPFQWWLQVQNTPTASPPMESS
jgi:hypothetical protein